MEGEWRRETTESVKSRQLEWNVRLGGSRSKVTQSSKDFGLGVVCRSGGDRRTRFQEKERGKL